MEKIWLKHYPAGVPAEIDPDKYQSIRDLFEESVGQLRRAPGVLLHGQAKSLSPSSIACRRPSARGCSRRAWQKGDRVALMMPNVLQYPVALFGVLRAGLAVVNVNPLYTPRELEHQLQGFGREGDRDPGELRAYAGAGDRAGRR